MEYQRASKVAEWFRKRGLKSIAYIYDFNAEDWHVSVEDGEGNKVFIASAKVSLFNPESRRKVGT